VSRNGKQDKILRDLGEETMMKLGLSLSVVGLLAVASALPASASTINLSTGETAVYTITSDTLSPTEGTTVHVVDPTEFGSGWVADLSGSQWIAPNADQNNADRVSEADSGALTYTTTFTLPTGFSDPSLSADLAADDSVIVSLNGSQIYSGPTTGQWTFDTALTPSQISSALSDLVAGSNTLQFVVTNHGTGSDAGGGPTGLDAQITLNYASVPEPSATLPLALAVLLGGGFVIRRRVGSEA
jgi:hypothetical protein